MAASRAWPSDLEHSRGLVFYVRRRGGGLKKRREKRGCGTREARQLKQLLLKEGRREERERVVGEGRKARFISHQMVADGTPGCGGRGAPPGCGAAHCVDIQCVGSEGGGSRSLGTKCWGLALACRGRWSAVWAEPSNQASKQSKGRGARYGWDAIGTWPGLSPGGRIAVAGPVSM